MALLILGLHHKAKVVAVFSLSGIWHERATVCRSGCQEGQKEEDGFVWLNFILFSLKYWDNLFLIIEEWEGKLLKSMQTAFAVSSNLIALQVPQVEVKNTAVEMQDFYFKPCADLSYMSPSFQEEILTYSELTCSCTNKCMTWERLRVDLND